MQVEYVNHMGNDDSVVNAARVSFSKEADNFTQEQNIKLINYLAKHNHWSPFSHNAVTLRVQCPISIRTQIMKHAVGFNINEESRRYISDTPELFIPEFRTKPEGSIKQGSGDTHHNNDYWQKAYKRQCQLSIDIYNDMLVAGIAPEQARFILPQGVETNFIWTGNLYSFARFYNLRSESHAQKEIQELAHEVANIIKPLFPVSWEALTGVKQ